MISAIEELWYGNIQPMEISHIERNSEYQEAIQLVIRNCEKVKSSLTAEQIDLLIRYSESRNELSNITELDAFKTGFTLGVKFIIEALT